MTQIFATGLQMGESPRWHDGRFWVSDWLAGEVLAFSADGAREVIARVDGLPFSIDWLPDGRLVVTTSDGLVAGPDLAPYGATGQPFNEIVVDSAGRCWVDMLGGDDGRTLFIVANHYSEAGASDGVVLTTQVDVPHAGRP